MHELTTVPFYGDELQAMRDGERVLVALRPMCEALGLDESGQRQRLQRQPWAGGRVSCPTLPTSGGLQPTVCLDLEIVPVWLATVQVGRVRPEMQEKLARYQREAAKVLADAFLRPGSTAVAVLDPQTLAIIERVATGISQPIVAALTRVEGRQQEHGERLGQIEAKVTTLEEALKYDRKRPGKKAKDEHIAFSRACSPRCRRCVMAPLFDEAGRFTGHIHHHDVVSDGSVDATMPLCASCNDKVNRDPLPRSIPEAYHHERKQWRRQFYGEQQAFGGTVVGKA